MVCSVHITSDSSMNQPVNIYKVGESEAIIPERKNRHVSNECEINKNIQKTYRTVFVRIVCVCV